MTMELADILTLVKAGYTKDEIIQMAQPQPVQSDPAPIPAPVENPAPDPEPVPAPAAEQAAAAVPVPAAQPAPAEQPAPVPVPAQPTMNDLMHSMAKLTSAIQANAIANSFIPGGSPREPDAAEVLGQIIRPTRVKKEV